MVSAGHRIQITFFGAPDYREHLIVSKTYRDEHQR